MKTLTYMGQLGLIGDEVNFDQILIALSPIAPATFTCAVFLDDYPKLDFASTGKRHVIEVCYAYSGYVVVRDNDISNGRLYYRTHDGNNYTPWVLAT